MFQYLNIHLKMKNIIKRKIIKIGNLIQNNFKKSLELKICF